jgi:hypothetical protein
MSGEVLSLSALEIPKLGLDGETEKDVSMFITCWTLEFMCMAIALKLTDEQVDAIADVGEYLQYCLGLREIVLTAKGARRRQRGGVDEEMQSALLQAALGIVPPGARGIVPPEALGNVPPEAPQAVELKRQIRDVQKRLVTARERALGKFKEGPSMANRLVRLLAMAGIAFMPIADKLISLGIRLKSEQYKASIAVAAVTAPAQMAATALADATLTALNVVDAGFAGIGNLGVEGATAAGEGIARTYDWFGNEIKRIQDSPGTRAEGRKKAETKAREDLETLKGWKVVDANAAKIAAYQAYFNSTADLLSQQPPPALEIGTDATRAMGETEGAQIVRRIREQRTKREQMIEGVKVLEGFKNFMSPFNTYMFMMAYLFKGHTMTYIRWSNMLGMTIAGIVAEDPVTVVLCITWVMSALVGVSWVARLLDALTTQAEVNTSLVIEKASAEALELKHLEDELKRIEKLHKLLVDGSAAPAQAGRRSTSRRRRRAAYLPRQTRRSSSGRRRGYSRRRRE